MQFISSQMKIDDPTPLSTIYLFERRDFVSFQIRLTLFIDVYRGRDIHCTKNKSHQTKQCYAPRAIKHIPCLHCIGVTRSLEIALPDERNVFTPRAGLVTIIQMVIGIQIRQIRNKRMTRAFQHCQLF